MLYNYVGVYNVHMFEFLTRDLILELTLICILCTLYSYLVQFTGDYTSYSCGYFKFELNFNVIKNHNIIGSIKLKLQP